MTYNQEDLLQHESSDKDLTIAELQHELDMTEQQQKQLKSNLNVLKLKVKTLMNKNAILDMRARRER